MDPNLTQGQPEPQNNGNANVQQAQANTNQGMLPMSGMAITSLVLGLCAILTSFLPIINNISFFIAILGVIFGGIALVGIRKGKKRGQGLGIAGLAISIISLVIVLATQSFYGAVVDAASNSLNSNGTTTSANASNSSAATADSSSDARYAVEIGDAHRVQDYSGASAIAVNYTFTNNSDRATSFVAAISADAFQNGVELPTAIVTSVDASSTISEIKPGASVDVTMCYSLSDESPVTVEVEELFNLSDTLIAEKTFSLS